MRIAVTEELGNRVLGRVEQDEFVPLLSGWDPLVAALEAGEELASLPPQGPPVSLADVTWAPPVRRPSAVACIGLNYADHARESGLEPPPWPLTFAKFANTLIGHDQPVAYNPADTAQLDWEVELAVVIGRTASRVTEHEALDHVLGYTVSNDVSARDVQLGESQWVRGKSFDGFCPLGPWVVTTDEIPDPQSLGLSLRVNGELMQDGTTKEMIFSVAQVIAFLSRTTTLYPGDVILTGTPYGVGLGRTPAMWLKDGDLMEASVEGIGTLRNKVLAR